MTGVLRRRRFRKARARQGFDTPREAGVMVVNCMSVSALPGRAARILARAAKYPGVVVIVADECSDLVGAYDAQKLLGSDWDVFHDHGDVVARRGSLLAVYRERATLTKRELLLGAPAAYGIRDRFLACGDVTFDPGSPHEWTEPFTAGHAPPMRAFGPGFANWLRFMASFRRRRGVKGGDLNRLGRAVAAVVRGQVRAVHIVALVVPRWIPAGAARAIDVGGDHMAVFVPLWPENRS